MSAGIAMCDDAMMTLTSHGTDQSATPDLAALASEGLLVPHGTGCGRVLHRRRPHPGDPGTTPLSAHPLRDHLNSSNDAVRLARSMVSLLSRLLR